MRRRGIFVATVATGRHTFAGAGANGAGTRPNGDTCAGPIADAGTESYTDTSAEHEPADEPADLNDADTSPSANAVAVNKRTITVASF